MFNINKDTKYEYNYLNYKNKIMIPRIKENKIVYIESIINSAAFKIIKNPFQKEMNIISIQSYVHTLEHRRKMKNKFESYILNISFQIELNENINILDYLIFLNTLSIQDLEEIGYNCEETQIIHEDIEEVISYFGQAYIFNENNYIRKERRK